MEIEGLLHFVAKQQAARATGQGAAEASGDGPQLARDARDPRHREAVARQWAVAETSSIRKSMPAGLFSAGKVALRMSPLPSQISARCLRLAQSGGQCRGPCRCPRRVQKLPG